jgi:hypothetical protein
MIVISLVTQADVAVLKCVYFQLVKALKEIDWYGLDCNVDQYISNIESAFTYLQILESGCTITHQLDCEIKTFITKNSSFCIFSDDKCEQKYEIINLGIVL